MKPENHIRLARKARKLKITEAAKLLDVSYMTYYYWDNGVSKPKNPKDIKKLKSVLGLSTDQILGLV